MRIAACISGQIRKFKNAYKSIKSSFLDKFDVDIFTSISTWTGAHDQCKSWSDGNLQEFLDLFQPKRCFITTEEEEVDIVKSCGDIGSTITCSKNSASAFYHIWNCNQLKIQAEKDKSFKYDYVIRMRSCTEFTKEFSKELWELSDDGSIIIPYGCDFLEGINDTLAFGKSESMNIYSCVFPNISKYSPKLMFHPERYLRHHLINENNMTIKRIGFPLLLRGSKFGADLDTIIIDNKRL